MKIAVLAGGASSERNVSLNGGIAVCKALAEKGHTAHLIDPALGLASLLNFETLEVPKGYPTLQELAALSPRNYIHCINSNFFDDVDLAFILLHGTFGEDGHVQALLRMRGVPYTGSGVKASSTAMDKVTSKLLMSSASITTPKWATLRAENIGDFELYETIRGELGKKMVVKPNDQGSTIGLSIIKNGNLDELHEGIKLALSFSSKALVEEYIAGRELTVGILDGKVLPIVEIKPNKGFYDYDNKYTSGNTQYICPAELSEDITHFTWNVAVSAYELMGCSGFARVDFRLDEENVPYCLEVNTVPGMTATSLLPMASKQSGIDFPALCDYIARLGVQDYNASITNQNFIQGNEMEATNVN